MVGETPVSYSWDAAGNPLGAAQGSAALSYAYDGAGRLSSVTLPNGVVAAYSYDSDSRIAAIAYSNGSGPLGNLTYTYDANGRVVSKGGSLASVVMPQTVTGNTFNAANEMTAFNGQPLTYDGNGDLLSDGTNSYTWDARNDLASLAGPVPAGFTYDSFGRRVSLTVNGGTTQYLYENGGTLAQEMSPAGVHLLSGLGVSRADLGGATTFVTDDDSTIALADNTGAIQTQYSYGPLGNVSITGTASTNPYQFRDMQNDGTGLYFGSAGYYNAAFGLNLGLGTVSAAAAGGNGFANFSAPSSVNATDSGNGSCKCSAKLLYHPVDYPPVIFRKFNHSFWWVDDGSGHGGDTISGEPVPNFYNGTLNAIIGQGSSNGYDNVAKSTLWDSWGPDPQYCDQVHCLMGAADSWPNGMITYLLLGPNSNTFARHLGDQGNFHSPKGAPPWTPGWNMPI